MENRRTTVVLDELLYRQAKRAAVDQDKSLKEIIEEALRIFLRGGAAANEKGRRASFRGLSRKGPYEFEARDHLSGS